MDELLLSYIKEMIYTNAVAIINYEDRGFSISVDFKFRWVDLNRKTTYHNGHYIINTKDYEMYKRVH